MEGVTVKAADAVWYPQSHESLLQLQKVGTRIILQPPRHQVGISRPERVGDRGDAGEAAGEAPLIGRLGEQSERQGCQEAAFQTPTVCNGGTCPLCKGAGYLRNDVPPGHPLFGKPVACKCKAAALARKRWQQLYDLSDLRVYRRMIFACFNPRVPGVQEAYHASREYARHPDGWLVLVGGYGCGKTHLAAAIANDCFDQGRAVYCSSVPDMLDHLRAALAPRAPISYDQLVSSLRTADLLVLDDLGAEQTSPWVVEKLYQLIDYRYTWCLPTVVTANETALRAVDERIRSRFQDGSLVRVVTMDRARDYRPFNRRAG